MVKSTVSTPLAVIVGLVVSIGAIFLLAYIFKESWNYAFVNGILKDRKWQSIEYWHALVAIIFLSIFFGSLTTLPRMLPKMK